MKLKDEEKDKIRFMFKKDKAINPNDVVEEIENILEKYEGEYGVEEPKSQGEWNILIEGDYRKLDDCPENIWVDFLNDNSILTEYITKDGDIKKRINKDGLFKYIAELVLKSRFFTFSDSEYTYYYEEGMYKLLPDSVIKNIVYTILRSKSLRSIVGEMLERIKYTKVIDREEVETPIDMVCLKNGILDLTNGKLQEHTPDLIFFNKLNVSYDKKAECPEIEKFVNRLLKGKYKTGFYEWVGYSMMEGNPYNKIGFFIGEGETGKSRAIALLAEFLGNENCTVIPVHDLARDKHYCRSTLHKKKLSYFADISSTAINDMSFIKTMSGEDRINARNIYGKPFNFKWGGKAVYSANQPPEFSEDNRAIWRRPLVFDFTHIITKKEKDVKILEKITTIEELSGLLNKGIEGLKNLTKRGEFANDKSITQTRDYYLSKGSSTYMFCKSCIKFDVECQLEVRSVYDMYLTFCSDKGLLPISKPKFIINTQLYTKAIMDTGTDNKRVFRGLGLKND